MSEVERTTRILDRVAELTAARNLAWEAEAMPGSFAAPIGDGWVRIASEDGDDAPPYRFSILNSDEEEVTALLSIPRDERSAIRARNAMLQELYSTARAQVLGIDDALQDVERQLGL